MEDVGLREKYGVSLGKDGTSLSKSMLEGRKSSLGTTVKKRIQWFWVTFLCQTQLAARGLDGEVNAL